jgi:hypothetical protein
MSFYNFKNYERSNDAVKGRRDEVILGDSGILFQHLPGTDEEKNRQYSGGDFLLPKMEPWTLRLRRMNVVEKRREKQVVAACP